MFVEEQEGYIEQIVRMFFDWDALDPKVQRILSGPQTNIRLETSPHLNWIKQYLVEIRIDPERCTKPGLCLKCQEACSFKAFTYVWSPFMPWGNFPELAQREGKMEVRFPHFCTLCGRCSEVCPEKAITIIPGAWLHPPEAGVKASPIPS